MSVETRWFMKRRLSLTSRTHIDTHRHAEIDKLSVKMSIEIEKLILQLHFRDSNVRFRVAAGTSGRKR